MDIIYYFRLVLWTAFRHSASLAQAILFLVFVIIGAAIWFLPMFGMTVNSSALLDILGAPQFYAILFGSVVIMRLICAPYWVWKAEREARLLAEAKFDKRARVLLDDQISLLVFALQRLRASLPSVAMAWTNGNFETEQYFVALRDVFHRAGIQTNSGFTIPDGPDDTGVLICLKNQERPPPEAAILKAALRQAGIETKTRPFTQDGMHVSDEMVLWVAPKPL